MCIFYSGGTEVKKSTGLRAVKEQIRPLTLAHPQEIRIRSTQFVASLLNLIEAKCMQQSKEIRIQDGSAPNIMHEFNTIVNSVTRLAFPGRIGFSDSY